MAKKAKGPYRQIARECVNDIHWKIVGISPEDRAAIADVIERAIARAVRKAMKPEPNPWDEVLTPR